MPKKNKRRRLRFYARIEVIMAEVLATTNPQDILDVKAQLEKYIESLGREVTKRTAAKLTGRKRNPILVGTCSTMPI